jgi:hypothetical protein
MPAIPTSKEELDFTYPSVTGAGVPNRFAMFNQNEVIFGPWPDASYNLELVGTVRPASLSSTNTIDLHLGLPAGSLHGGLDDLHRRLPARLRPAERRPADGGVVDELLRAAQGASFIEENRKKFWSNGWTSRMPAPTSTPDVGQYPAARA